MASLAALYVSLEARVSGYVTGMGAAAKATRDVEASALRAGRTIASVNATITASAARLAAAQDAAAKAQQRVNRARAIGSPEALIRRERELAAATRELTRAQQAAAAAARVQEAGAKDTVAAATRVKNILEKVAKVAGVLVVAGMLASANAAVQLEKRLYNVATISDKVAGDIPGFTQRLVEMSKAFPQSANSLAEGLYDIVSTGFEADQALVVLEASARAASAGMTDTATSSKAIAAVLKAYGLGAESAADVSDVLFRTVDKGVITFEELSQQLGDFIGVGAAAKVPIDDLGSAIAAITLSGVPAAEAATSLNNLLSKMIKPSEALNRVYRQLGYESGATALEQDGLYGVMEKLRGATGGNVEQLLRLFPEIRAARGAFSLMAASGANYAQTQAAISDEVERYGATQDALTQQSKSASYQFGTLKNEVTALAIEFGTALLPAIKNIIGFGTDMAQMFGALPGPVKEFSAQALTVVATLGLLGGAAMKLRGPLRALTLQMGLMRAAGSGLPATLTTAGKAMGILGIAALAGAAIYGQYAEQKRKATESTKGFTDALMAEQQGQAGALRADVIRQLTEANAIGGRSNVEMTMVKALQEVNADLDVVVTGVTGSAEQYKLAQAEFAKTGPGLLQGTGQLDKLRKQYIEGGKAAEFQATATDTSANAARRAAGPIGDLTALVLKDKSGTEQLSGAQEGLRKSLESLLDPAEAATTALKGLADPARVFADLNSQLSEDARKAAQNAKERLDERGQAALQAAQDASTEASRVAADAGKGQKKAAQAEAREAADRVKAIERQNKARTKAYDDGNTDVTASLAQWTAGLQQSAREQNAWERDLTIVARRAGPNVAEALRAMGGEALPLIAEIATGTNTEVAKVKAAFDSLAPSARRSLGAFTLEMQAQLTAQAKWAGSLATLAARGQSSLVEEFTKLAATNPQDAAALAAQAAKSTDKELNALSSKIERRDRLTAGALEQGYALLASNPVQSGTATAMDVMDAFGGSIDLAQIALLNLQGTLTDLPTQKTIQVLLDLVMPKVAVDPASPLGKTISQSGLLLPPKGTKSALDAFDASGASYNAHGNILEFYGRGGMREQHVAQIARGTTRVWAEPETGGEAYIPLAPGSKRARSLNILGDVAQRFGMRVQPTAAASLVQGQPVRGYSQPVMRPAPAGMVAADVQRIAAALAGLSGNSRTYQFTGAVNANSLADIQRQAEAAERLSNLAGGY